VFVNSLLFFANRSLVLLSTRYFAAEFGGWLVVPEAQVDAFGQDHVPPVPSSFEDAATGKTIHYWTKLIAWLLEVSVSTYVQEKKITTDEAALGWLKSMDVVLGGNHGQGKF
jgi:hypothetical protein